VALEEADALPGFAAIRAYFAGRLGALADVPADDGGTAFQRRAWAALRAIPPGETRSYGDIAACLDQPRAARAVGLANALNPISLVVPCHRVVGRAGGLTGYGGGSNASAGCSRMRAPEWSGDATVVGMVPRWAGYFADRMSGI
jgi:methylated-DNA-[protein]-cysteine S-methyltransferase